MAMRWHLLSGQCRLADSAGHIRSWPRRQRLLLGSGRPHDVRQSVVRWQAAGLSRRSRQTVRVGLRSARKKRRCVCVAILRIGLVYAGTVGRKHKFLHNGMRAITEDEIVARAEQIKAHRAFQGGADHGIPTPTLSPWQMPSHSHTVSPCGGCYHAHCYCCPLR